MNLRENKNQDLSFDSPGKTKIYRFDIFKGAVNQDGKLEKVCSVGHATLYEGSATYTVYLKMLLKDQFYLLPEREIGKPFDFVVLTREPSSLPGKKYFWNRVGTAKLLSNQNAGIMRLDFDLLIGADLYLNFHDSTAKEQDSPAA
jgi:hypothetical protein